MNRFKVNFSYFSPSSKFYLHHFCCQYLFSYFSLSSNFITSFLLPVSFILSKIFKVTIVAILESLRVTALLNSLLFRVTDVILLCNNEYMLFCSISFQKHRYFSCSNLAVSGFQKVGSKLKKKTFLRAQNRHRTLRGARDRCRDRAENVALKMTSEYCQRENDTVKKILFLDPHNSDCLNKLFPSRKNIKS